MKCAEYKRLFSPYLDGQVSGAEMHALQQSHEGVCRLRAGICRSAAHVAVASRIE